MTGKLEIDRSGDYHSLSHHFPIEIRDSNQKLVQRVYGSGVQTLNLDVGLYSVDVVLEDGGHQSRVVQVQDGETSSVQFGVERRKVSRAEMYAKDATVEVSRGARLTRTNPPWIVVPDEGLEEVPTASIQTAQGSFVVSLPINPKGEFPLNSCEVQPLVGRRRVRIRVRMAEERQIASTMESMIEAGFVEQVARIGPEAVELLFHKYKDPVGAAFGGLVMHRLGELEPRSRWVENLARDFSWLPDGRILHAALLSKASDRERRDRGLQLLLEAAPQRLMFTDGLSLALDLLRRWPDEEAAKDRHKLLEQLSQDTAHTLWGEVVLTHFFTS